MHLFFVSPASAAWPTLAPNADKIGASFNSGTVQREDHTSSCALNAIALYDAIDEVGAATSGACVNGSTSADYITANNMPPSTTRYRSFELDDLAPAGAIVHTLRVEYSACKSGASTNAEININLYLPDGPDADTTPDAVDNVGGVDILSACNTFAKYGMVFRHVQGLTKAQLDSMYVRVIFDNGDPVNTATLKLTQFSVIAESCDGTSNLCGRVREKNLYSALPWAPCDGVTANVKARIGGVTYSTTCDDATGEYNFIQAVAANSIVVVWLDHATDRGATYLRASGNKNHADIFLSEVTMDSYTGVALTNADIETWDQDNEARIPVSVAGTNDLTEVSPIGLRIMEDAAFSPAGDLTVSNIIIGRFADLTNAATDVITLTRGGTGGGCAADPIGTRMPLCSDASAQLISASGSVVRFTGTTTTEVLSASGIDYHHLELLPASGTVTFRTSTTTSLVNVYGDLLVGRPDAASAVNYQFQSSSRIDVRGNMTVSQGSTFSGNPGSARNLTVGGSLQGAGIVSLGGMSSVTMWGSAAATLGPTDATDAWNLDDFQLRTSGGTARTVSLAAAGSGTITFSNFTLGSISDTVTSTLTLDAPDRPVTVNGATDITSRGALVASASERLELREDVTRTGTLTPSGGTVRLAPSSTAPADGIIVLAYAAPTTFANLELVGPGRITFDNADQTSVTGTLTASSTGCLFANRLFLGSDLAGTQWELAATGTVTASNVMVQDSAASPAITAGSPSLDNGNNTGWTFSPSDLCLPPRPTGMLGDDANAQAGTGRTNPSSANTPIDSTSFHTSWTNADANPADGFEAQTWSTPPEHVGGLWHFDGTGLPDPLAAPSTVAWTGTPSLAGAGVFGQAASLNGTTQYGMAPHDSRLSAGSGFTVEAWFKSNDLFRNADPVLVQKSSGAGCTTNCTYSLEVDQALKAFCAIVTVAGTQRERCGATNGALAYSDDQWHHYALSYDTSFNLRLYVDGALHAGPFNLGAGVDTNTAAVAIGTSTSPSATNHFAGQIDEVRFSPVAHDAGAIRGYYKARRPHAQLLWGSGPQSFGVCAAAARCADHVYGTFAAGDPDILRADARYYQRTRLRSQTTGELTAWGVDWLETRDTSSVTVSVGDPVAFSMITPGVDSFETAVIDVSSNGSGGYALLARDESDAWALDTLGCVVPSCQIPDRQDAAVAPALWPLGASSGFGVTVRAATGGRLARWAAGADTGETDVTNNRYAGLDSSTDQLLHRRFTPTTVTDQVTVTFRMNAPGTLDTGSYEGLVALTVLATP